MGDASQPLAPNTNQPWLGPLLLLLLMGFGLWSQLPSVPIAMHPQAYLSLPQAKDIEAFARLNRDFGFSQTILVGLKAPKGKDVFDPRMVNLNREMTQKLREHRGFENILSLASSPSIRKVGNTLEVRDLLPKTLKQYNNAQQAQTRELVMSDPMFRGSIVSADGKATFLLCRLKPKHIQEGVAYLLSLREQILRKYPEVQLTLTGQTVVAPLSAPMAFADIRAFLPVALALFLLLLWLIVPTWQARVGSLLLLALTVLVGIFALIGQQGQISLHLMWVPLLAWWSLAALFAHPVPMEPANASASHRTIWMSSAILVGVGALALWATAEPLSKGLGTATFFACMAGLCCIGLFFLPYSVPSVHLLSLRLKVPQVGWIVGLVGVVLLGTGMFKLQFGGLPDAIYPKGGPLAQGETLQQRHFRGAAPLFLRFYGDLRDPVILKSIERVGRRLASHPDIYAPQSLAELIRHLNQLMNQWPRIPDTKRQINALRMFLDGQPALQSLVRKQDKDGVLQARVQLHNGFTQRHLLDTIQHFLRDLPLRYQAVSFDALTPAQQRTLRKKRADWVEEGFYLWLHRQVDHPIHAKLKPTIRRVIENFVDAGRRANPSLVLEPNRLQRKLWKYLSHKDCDIEIEPPTQLRVLRALLATNAKAQLLQPIQLQKALQSALQGTPAAKDKSSIRYALRALQHITTQLYQQQLLEMFQQQLFVTLRTSPALSVSLTNTLRRQQHNAGPQGIAELQAELLEIFNPQWVRTDIGPSVLRVEHTGLHSILLSIQQKTTLFLSRATLGLTLLIFFLLALFRLQGAWRIALGIPCVVIATLGVMGFLHIPLHLPSGLIVLLLVFLFLFIALPLHLAPSPQPLSFPLHFCLWLSLPFVPFAFASLPLIQQLATLLAVGPWIVSACAVAFAAPSAKTLPSA